MNIFKHNVFLYTIYINNLNGRVKVRPHQTRISRHFYARYARKMLLDHIVSKMVTYAQYAPYAPTSLA